VKCIIKTGFLPVHAELSNMSITKFGIIRIEELRGGGVLEIGPVVFIRGSIQKFPDWLRGARTANGTALCH
jgi:hypothetical protein